MADIKFIEEINDVYALSVFYMKECDVYTESKVYIKSSDIKQAIDTSLHKFEQFQHERGTRHFTYMGEFANIKSKLQIDEEHVDLILIYLDSIFLRFECINSEYFKIQYNVRGMEWNIEQHDLPKYLNDVCIYIGLVYTMTWDSRFLGVEN